MPCRSDHMEQNAGEAYRQRTAQVMATAAIYLEEASGFLLVAKEHASNPYCAVDFTADLCAALAQNDTGPLPAEKTMSWNHMIAQAPTNRGVRRLLDWWEDHKEGEKRRAKEDNAKCIAEEEARNKPLHTDEDYWGHTPGDDTFYIED